MSKKRKIAIGITSGIILAIAIGVFVFYQHQFSAPQKGAEIEKITINLTTTEEELIPKLKEQGYIRNEWAFNYVLKKKSWQGKIQPGAYKVSKAMNAWQLAEVLVSEPYMKWVVIPEGLRKEQIAELIGDTLGWDQETKEKWISNYTAMKYEEVEGIYFPDTYLIPTDETPLQVADRLRAKFNEKFQPYTEKFIEANIKWTTALKIASLVQREAASKEDMPLIAGIIWNRLLHDPPMKLEIDATVQYARDSIAHYDKEPNDIQPSRYSSEGDWWTPIKVEDKQIESPYNTYLNKGLPPHPICNPGLDAIDAVLNAAETECLYYLHDSERQIHCAKTYEEHKKNIEKYFLES